MLGIGGEASHEMISVGRNDVAGLIGFVLKHW